MSNVRCFGEPSKGELPRIPVARTRVNTFALSSLLEIVRPEGYGDDPMRRCVGLGEGGR